jgi:hypothetical protein
VKLEERMQPVTSNVIGGSPWKKNRRAEATANGKAGLPNQYWQFFHGCNTLNGHPNPEEDGLRR